MQSVLRSQANQTHVHRFTGGDSGKKQTEAQHINKDSSTVSGLSLFYICYWSAADGDLADTTSNIWTDVTGRQTPFQIQRNTKTFLFLPITVRKGHDIRDKLRDYWRRQQQFFAPLYPNTTRDRLLHVFSYLNFTENDNDVVKNDDNYDRLLKLRGVFGIRDVAYSKPYSPPEHRAVDKVTVHCKRKVAFKLHIPKKHKRAGIKI
jgi:hypothetical protein